MATKYVIAETSETEASEPFSRKEYAVEAADKAAEQYPGVTFLVKTTTSGKVVHTALAESVDMDDEPPADEVPEVQVDADIQEDDFNAVLAQVVGGGDLEPEQDEDVDADFEPETDTDIEAGGEEDPGHGLEVVSTEQALVLIAQADAEDAPQEAAAEAPDTAPAGTKVPEGIAALAEAAMAAAPSGATLELCAANTNAKRTHYRTVGEQRTACGSASTSRRANAHQIETAALCTACAKLATGKTVDTRPAGAARGTGSRKSPKTVVIDAGEIRDLVAHLKKGDPFEMETADGTRLRFVAGDPVTGEESADLGDVRSITIVSA